MQHLEGGIVRDILVHEGDTVAEGQVLMRLDDTQTTTTVGLLRDQADAMRALEARLIAERNGAETVAFPPELESRRLEPSVAAVLDGQRRIFVSRKEGLDGQQHILEQRIEQLGAEIRGYKAQVASASEQISLIHDEIASVEALLAKGLERKPRLLALQRQASAIEGNRGEQLGFIAKAEQAIGETQLQAADLLNRRQNEIALELRETQDKLVEIEDKLHLASDIDRRTALTAPVAGRVVDMRVHTAGGVLRPGEPVLDIVPEADTLIVEARVNPTDIDSVRIGAPAQVSLTAFKTRTTPRLDGAVAKVSADALVGEDRSSYYEAEVQIDPGELEALADVTLTPGMPAEVMIHTGERTFLQYIAQPIVDSFHRAFREE